MVKLGPGDLKEIHYDPPGTDVAGIEVVSLEELQRRLSRARRMRGPQRPDFHQLLAVQAGVIRHMVDFSEHTATPTTWLWVRPGQVQQFRDLTTGTGWIVLFRPDALDPAASGQTGLDEPFAPVSWHITGEERAAVTRALDHLVATYSLPASQPTGVRADVLRHLLAVLLLQLRFHGEPVGSTVPPPSEAFLRLREAVEERFDQTRHVADYAQELGYTPRTLTRATLASVGIGAKAFIDRRVVLEAQRLLAHGDEPVATIAYRLGFDDASNFVKYFVQRTGTTPGAFRRQMTG